MHDLFSAVGIARWRERLNRSPLFAEAAKDWAGTLVLVEVPDRGASRRAWVRVAGGICIEARVADADDEQAAEFVLSAAPDTWNDLTAARTTPTMAAMMGKLRLLRGNLFLLAPHARAAAALLAAANAEPDGV